jgi:hypothetical protein
LFEFENIWDLNLNRGFKFNSAAKVFQKHSYFLSQPKFPFGPITVAAHFLFRFEFPRVAQPRPSSPPTQLVEKDHSGLVFSKQCRAAATPS